jgi:hypothetical protein
MNPLLPRIATARRHFAPWLAAILLVAAANGWGGEKVTPSAATPERLGIAGGYFSCTLPANWTRQDDPLKPGDKTYQLTLLGPRAENAPVMIVVSFFGPGNDDFKDYTDFVTRNTTDLWSDKPKAEARKTEINGIKALGFEREAKSFLHPESKSDESVMIKEKFYVLLARDRVGFFVLNYSAPSSVFAEHLPVFEKIAGSFELK